MYIYIHICVCVCVCSLGCHSWNYEVRCPLMCVDNHIPRNGYATENHLTGNFCYSFEFTMFNPLTLNDDYSCHTTPPTSKRCILYIYSTNIGTEYFKHGIYSPFFPLQNAVCFINLTCLVPVLFIFYMQGVLKLKKNISGTKRLM